MRILEVMAVIDRLPAAQPLTDAYEARGCLGSSRTSKGRCPHQKQHLLGWLSQYSGPGAYGRKQGSDDPRLAYNRFQCAPGLVWLAESVGEDPEVVARAVAAAEAAPARGATQCRAVREVVPWSRIEELAERLPRSPRVLPPGGGRPSRAQVAGGAARTRTLPRWTRP